MALFVLLAAILPSVLAKFTNPPDIIRGTFHLGDRETIKYDTSFNNYTIALWQQAPQGGAAKLGPILFGKYIAVHCRTGNARIFCCC